MPRNNRLTAADNEQDAVYKLLERILVSEDDRGIVTLSDPQDHKIQRVFRKLKFRIPEYRKWTLDAYGSFIVKLLREGAPVSEIAQKVKEKFGLDAEPLFERLLPYLQMLEGRKLIERIDLR